MEKWYSTTQRKAGPAASKWSTTLKNSRESQAAAQVTFLHFDSNSGKHANMVELSDFYKSSTVSNAAKGNKNILEQ